MSQDVIDKSTIVETDSGYEHRIKLIVDDGPALDQVDKLRLANSIRQKGWSDNRLMRFRAQIPAWRVWEAENILGYNLHDKRDFKAYLALHPEYIISPENTGATGQIIIKGV